MIIKLIPANPIHEAEGAISDAYVALLEAEEEKENWVTRAEKLERTNAIKSAKAVLAQALANPLVRKEVAKAVRATYLRDREFLLGY